jgi:nitrous oxidase accessory protein
MPWIKSLILGVCVMLASVASGAVIRVCAAGGAPYTTIQEGVNAAEPGDTVRICTGTYNESVLIAKSRLRIQGEAPLGSVLLTCPDPSGVGVWITAGSNNTIQGLDVSSCSAGMAVGFSPEIAEQNALIGNSIHHNTFSGIALSSHAAETLVLANNVTGNETGVFIDESRGDRILANIVIGRGNDPFGTFGLIVAFATGAELRHNIITSHATALELFDTTNSRVENNEIRDNFYYGMGLFGSTGSTGNTIARNISDANGFSGLYANSVSTGNVFRVNHAHGNGYNAEDLGEQGADARDDDTNTWRNNFCDTALGHATCKSQPNK